MRLPALAMTALAMLATVACSYSSPRSRMATESLPPDKVMDFDTLFAQNCSGCHGARGIGAPAPPIGNPVYLVIADDATIRRVATNGVPGTPMAAFAQSAGGMLTDKQIDVIVSGIRSQWAKSGALEGANPPPYSSSATGDANRGATAFKTYCSSCHGPTGAGTARASSIVDGSYLALVSDQGLRTAVIVGRPEMGFPDWRHDAAGHPMSAQDVSDVVAWLAAQRPKYPGQPYRAANDTAGESK